MQKFLCCLLSLLLLLLPILCLHASATDSLLGVGLDYLTWFTGTSFGITNGNLDFDELNRFYSTPEGRVYLSILDGYFVDPDTGQTVSDYIKDANDKKYIASNMSKELVDKCFDSLNSYMRVGNSSIRNVTLDDLGISVGNNQVVVMGYLQGSGSFVSRDLVHYNDNTKHTGLCHYLPDSPPSDKVVYIYPGSYDFPACIFTFYSDSTYVGYTSVPIGVIIPLTPTGSDVMLLTPPNFGDNFSFLFDDTYTLDYGPLFFSGAYGGCNSQHIGILSDGNYHFFYEDPVMYFDLLTKSVGIHICDSATTPIPPPSDIPYEDDQVVVLSPAEEPGEPIYLSPSTYNNYINNGTYTTINEGDINYYIDDSTVNNFINVYNGSGSSSGSSSGGTYDDSTLLNRLHGWFSSVIAKLDEIIGKLPPSDNNPPSDGESDSGDTDININVDTSDIPNYGTWLPPWLSWLDPDPCYDNFSDCIFDNIEIFSVARDSINYFNAALSDPQPDQSDSKNNIVLSGAVDGAGDDVSSDGDVKSWLNSIDTYIDYKSRVAPFATVIRPFTTILAYSLAIVSVWRSLKSVFGINVDVSDAATGIGSLFESHRKIGF